MKNNITYHNLFRTDSLYLASALTTAGFPIDSLEGDFPSRVTFVFIESNELLKTVEDFHSNKLQLPAKELLYGQKELKDRLWEESRRI